MLHRSRMRLASPSDFLIADLSNHIAVNNMGYIFGKLLSNKLDGIDVTAIFAFCISC
jgi:hypothetical protein